MNKEQLVFEMFKERIGKQYIATLKTGTKLGAGKEVYIELKEYCLKIGADLSKVQKLLNKYKRQLLVEVDAKRLERIAYKDKTEDLHVKIRKNIENKERKKVNKFIERNTKK